MRELERSQETALIECLRALDGGATLDDCLARYPQQAEALRPLLELRARVLSFQPPEPSALAYASGRQALLERLRTLEQGGAAAAPARGGLSGFLAGGWRRFESPLPRFAAAAAVLVLLAGGAIGASAAAGLNPARDVLSALPIVDWPPEDAGSERQGTADAGGGRESGAPTAPSGQGAGPEPAANGSGAAPKEVPGVGLCFAQGKLPDLSNLPDPALEAVPDLGVCVPEKLLEHAPDGAACVPPHVLERVPSPLREALTACQPAGGEPPADVPRPTGPAPGRPSELPDAVPDSHPGSADPPGAPPARGGPSDLPDGAPQPPVPTGAP